MKSSCKNCGKEIKNAHLNRKWCMRCSENFRKKPRGTLNNNQIEIARSLAGTMYREDICKQLGISLTNLKRSCQGISFNFKNKWIKNPDYVSQIIKDYESGGKKLVLQKYPGISYRSVVERYKRNEYILEKWSDSDLIKIARLSCFITQHKQIKIFGRNRYTQKAIQSVWNKKFPICPTKLQGLPYNKAKHFVSKKCPVVEIPFFAGKHKRSIFLWIDMKEHLKKDCPSFVADAINALATFQVWLFDGKPREQIGRLLDDSK